MTRTQRALANRWRSIATACAIVALFGLGAIIWARIDAESSRADQFAAEADRRGTAVTTLAEDVRALRAQVRAQGSTPIAPDPGDAVEGLDDRGTVPVPYPVPGEKGDKGDPGEPGKPAPTLTPAPGASGAPGLPGQDATGVPGKDGQDGQDGRDGVDGQDGQPPAGWTWIWTDQRGDTHTYACTPVPDFDPDAPRYQCTETSQQDPKPDPSPNNGLNLLGMALEPRRRY